MSNICRKKGSINMTEKMQKRIHNALHGNLLTVSQLGKKIGYPQHKSHLVFKYLMVMMANSQVKIYANHNGPQCSWKWGNC